VGFVVLFRTGNVKSSGFLCVQKCGSCSDFESFIVDNKCVRNTPRSGESAASRPLSPHPWQQHPVARSTARRAKVPSRLRGHGSIVSQKKHEECKQHFFGDECLSMYIMLCVFNRLVFIVIACTRSRYANRNKTIMQTVPFHDHFIDLVAFMSYTNVPSELIRGNAGA